MATPADPAVPLTRRLTPGYWVTVDAVLALFLAAGSIGGIATGHHAMGGPGTGWDPLRYAAVLAACLPLPFRRLRPRPVLVSIVAADAVLLALGSRVPAHVMAGFAMYSWAAGSPRRIPLSSVLAAVVPLVAAALVRGTGRNVETFIFAPVVVIVGWLAGENARARRLYARDLAERAAERERARARQAAADERVRIARELHDVVAHAMSVVAVRSGVARAVMDSRPEEAAEALRIIETVSRRGLGELRRIVGVMRRADGTDGPDPAELAPAPGLADLPTLVEEVGEAGVRVSLVVEGTPRVLDTAQDLSAYRIAQEALTNVVRHAGPTTAVLHVRYAPDAVEIDCVDTGGAVPPAPGPDSAGGHGLVGMRERVALYGGSLSAGPEGRGFRVRARLPLAEEGL